MDKKTNCKHIVLYRPGWQAEGTGGEISFGGINQERYIEPLVYHPVSEEYGMYAFFCKAALTLSPLPLQYDD